MTHWNNRLWKCKNDHEEYIVVKETYYNDKGEVCACTENPLNFYAYSLDDMLVTLDRVKKAVEAAVLDDSLILVEDGFIFAEWSYE